MTNTIFWRLAWKEYRQQRDLMIGIVIIACAIFAIMLAWSLVEGRAVSTSMVYHTALLMPIFFALGCGATLFAGEHERETFGFLRSLPLRARDVFWPKVSVAVASCTALTAMLLAIAAIITQGRPFDSVDGAPQAVVYLVTLVAVLAWSIFYSLLLRNPLWAVAAAGLTHFALLVGMTVLATIVYEPLRLNPESAWVYLFGFQIAYALVFLGVLVATGYLGYRWLDRGDGFAIRVAPAAVEVATAPPQPATRFTKLTRLVWQTWRESRMVFLAIYGAIGLFCLFLMLNQTPPFAFVVLPAVLGSFAFFNDQWKQHHRFFAEHGVDSRTLWWSRIAASLLACLPWLLVAMAVILTVEPNRGPGFSSVSPDRQWSNLVWPADLLVLGLLYIAFAQLCSLLFRAGIVGLFTGIASTLFLFFGLLILRFLGIPDWLGVYPLAVLFLWASWLRSADWLLERNSWRRWSRWSGSVAIPLGLYVVALGMHRAYEIPALAGTERTGPSNVPAGIEREYGAALAELQRRATADELHTAELYRGVWREMRALTPRTVFLQASSPPAGDGSMGAAESPGAAGAMGDSGAADPAVAAENEKLMAEYWEQLGKLVDRFVEASKRPDCDFVNDPLGRMPTDETNLPREIVGPVQQYAGHLATEQRHDEAIECQLSILRFLRHYQLRGDYRRCWEAIRMEENVLEELVALLADRPAEQTEQLASMLKGEPYNWYSDQKTATLREYLLHSAMIRLDDKVWRTVGLTPQQSFFFDAIFRYQPWERERSQRLFDYVMMSPEASLSPQVTRWHENTIMGRFAWMPGASHWDPLSLRQHTHRAALQLRLLLLGYRARHDMLPESLAALEEEYPGRVPPDPATNRPFVYRPEGVKGELIGADAHSDRVPADTPFVWSFQSPNVHGFGRSFPWNDAVLTAYDQVLQGNDEKANELVGGTWTSLWQGRAFLIPPAEKKPPQEE